MPELPEVETVVRELNNKLKGKTIKSVEIRLPKVVAIGPGAVPPRRQVKSSKVLKFVKLLTGQKIASVARRAKLLIFDFERKTGERPLPNPPHAWGGDIKIDGSLAMLVHLKMTGQFIYFKKSELNKKIRIINKATAPVHAMPCKYTHAIFTFNDGSKLFYNDVRQFGYLKLVSDTELPFVRDLTEYGPEPLSLEFTFDVFRSILKRRPNLKIKQLLTDPKLIAGIGNIYSDEILFHAKVLPIRIVLRIKNQELRRIFKAIKKVLKKGIEAKGSSVGDFIRTDGSWGAMGKYHYVYMRSGMPCKVCGTTIKSAKFNGRTGSFCPKCQH